MPRQKYQQIFYGSRKKKPKSTYYRHLKIKQGRLNLGSTEQNHYITNIVPESINNIVEINSTLESFDYNEDNPVIQCNEIDHNSPSNFFDLIKEDQIQYTCISLLSLFYTGNFTQSGLDLIISHLQNFVTFKIPASFDQLLKRIQGKSLDYKKIWYCPKCNLEVTPLNCYQRECLICSDKTK